MLGKGDEWQLVLQANPIQRSDRTNHSFRNQIMPNKHSSDTNKQKGSLAWTYVEFVQGKLEKISRLSHTSATYFLVN